MSILIVLTFAEGDLSNGMEFFHWFLARNSLFQKSEDHLQIRDDDTFISLTSLKILKASFQDLNIFKKSLAAK